MYKVKLSRFTEYEGDLNVSGHFKLIQMNNSVKFEYNLSGLEPNSVGGWHVHDGTCAAPGGLTTNEGTDLFHQTMWNSEISGNSVGSELIPDIILESLKDKVLIVHNTLGVKVACSKIIELVAGCGLEYPVSECQSYKAFDKSQVHVSMHSNNLVIKNYNSDGISIKGISLILDNVENNKYLKSYNYYTGFNDSQINPTNIAKNGSVCFKPNEGYIASYGTYTYSNLIENQVSLMNNVGTYDIRLKHGTFVQGDTGSSSGSGNMQNSFKPPFCPHPASHQVNMITSISNYDLWALSTGEGEFSRPLVATNQPSETGRTGTYTCNDQYPTCILYPTMPGNLGGLIHVAWVNSAYNIFNFNNTVLNNHNNIAHGDSKTFDVDINSVIGNTTSYRNKNTNYRDVGPNDYDIHIINESSKLSSSPVGEKVQGTPAPTPAGGAVQVAPPPPEQNYLQSYNKILERIISEKIFENFTGKPCLTNVNSGFDNSWKNSVFYIGEDLPYLQQYKDIEAEYSKDTNYGGKYIQVHWAPAVFHAHRTIELYITRENQYQITKDKLKKNQDSKASLDILGKDLNGLVSFSDSYGCQTETSKMGFNIPLFVLHRALSMGNKSFISDNTTQGCINQSSTALYNLKGTNNIFHGIFMWSVTDAAFWQQPFNLIFTNNKSWYYAMPNTIVLKIPEESNIVTTAPLIIRNEDSPRYPVRLYQWGHYTLNLTGWKYPPSGVTYNTSGQKDSGAYNPINGGETNSILNKDAFDKKYTVTDPWGEWSNGAMANFFKTFNGGEAPSPCPDCSSAEYFCPTCPPGPAPGPAPGPGPGPGPSACPGPGCAPIDPCKNKADTKMCCNQGLTPPAVTNEPNKKAMGWEQAKFNGTDWIDVHTGKTLKDMPDYVDTYNCGNRKESGVSSQCGPLPDVCPWSSESETKGQASLGHMDQPAGPGSSGGTSLVGIKSLDPTKSLGKANDCVWTTAMLGAHGLCDYKTNCWSDNLAAPSSAASCRKCMIPEASGGCLVATELFSAPKQCPAHCCPTCLPTPSPTPGPSPSPTPGPSPSPTPGPSPSPTPGPSPAPAPGDVYPAKCTDKGGIGCPMRQVDPLNCFNPEKAPKYAYADQMRCGPSWCNKNSKKSNEPNKFGLGWNQTIKIDDKWIDFKTMKPPPELNGPPPAWTIYNEASLISSGPNLLCKPYPTNGSLGMADIKNGDPAMELNLGIMDHCDNTNHDETIHHMCDYKLNCWADAGGQVFGHCRPCLIPYTSDGCLYKNSVYTGEHYIRMLDNNLTPYHTHDFNNAHSPECLKNNIYLTSKKVLFNAKDYHIIKDTTYLHTDQMVYFAIPKILDKSLSERTINLNIHEPLFDIHEKTLYINLDNLRENISNQLIINEDYCSITSLYITDTHNKFLGETGCTIELFNGTTIRTIKIPYIEETQLSYDIEEISLAVSSSSSFNNHYINIQTFEKNIVSHVFHLLHLTNISNISRPKVSVEHILNNINYTLNDTDELTETKIYAIGSSTKLKLLTSNKESSIKYTIFNSLEQQFFHDITNIRHNTTFTSNTTLLHYKTIKNLSGTHNIITLQPYNSLFVNSINGFINTSLKFNNIVSNYNGSTSVLNNILYNIIFNHEWQEYSGVKAIKEHYSFLKKSKCKIEVTFKAGNSTGTEGEYDYDNTTDNNNYILSTDLI